MSYDDFLTTATREFTQHARDGYRFGQALYNALVRHRPDLAEQVRGTDIDPFYEDTIHADCVIGNFLVWVQDNWEGSR